MKYRALFAEFIATFAMTFIGILAISASKGDLTVIALAHGLAFVVFITAVMAVSGGHVNPAVTLGMMVTRNIGVGLGIGYILAQIAGAFVAASVANTTGIPGIVLAGTPSLGDGITANQGLVLEAVATFFLVFVAFTTTLDRRAPKMGGTFVGLVIACGIFAIGPLTGGGMNPARWLGPALSTGELGPAIVYLGGPALGALVAALVYSSLFAERDTVATAT